MTVGVLLATYGSPAGLDDVRRYLEHILRREPAREEVEGLRRRYEAAGGTDALPRMTERQASLLQRELSGRGEFVVALGYRHSAPFLGDVAAELARRVESGVVLPLAPHYNTMSVAGYFRAAHDGFAKLPRAPTFALAPAFNEHPGLVSLWAERVAGCLKRLEQPERAAVLFTAHSLPARVLAERDPYPAQLRRTAELVAAEAGVRAWRLCYQSAPPHGHWLGPDILDELSSVKAGGARAVIVAPIGFASDHMETRCDLDVEAKRRADDLGLEFARLPAPNDAPEFIRCLADVARAALRA